MSRNAHHAGQYLVCSLQRNPKALLPHHGAEAAARPSDHACVPCASKHSHRLALRDLQHLTQEDQVGVG